jgi:hypothetical protein
MSKKETKKEKPPCPVCMDHFTPIIRQPIVCAYCPHAVCRQCSSQYLLTTLNDPHCMNCKREWNREFIDTKLTQTFRKGPLKYHRRRVLMDREKGRLPAMQVFVQAQSTIVTNSNRILALRQERKRLKQERNRIQVAHAEEGFQALAQRLQPITKELSDKKLEIRTLERALNSARAILTGQEKPEARQFIMKCPAEECRGFLSSAWKCGTCEKFFCSDCHAQKTGQRDEEHVCNEDAKATAAMIRQETKPCPKCGIRISKIDGCDQMWCTECHTTFSWNSGQILLNTVVHNPHYYEYLRKANGGNIPREAGDVPCGGLPNPFLFSRYVHNSTRVLPDTKDLLITILRGLQDIQAVRLPRFALRQNANVNRDIDILYLMNEITEEEWGMRLEQAETRFERNKEIGLILQTFVHIGSEKLTVVMNLTDPKQEKEVFERTAKEMEEVRIYINNALIQKGIQMGIVVPQFDRFFNYGWASKETIKTEKANARNTVVYPGQAEEGDETEEDLPEVKVEEKVVEEVHPKTQRMVMVEIDGEFVELPEEAVH